MKCVSRRRTVRNPILPSGKTFDVETPLVSQLIVYQNVSDHWLGNDKLKEHSYSVRCPDYDQLLLHVISFDKLTMML